MTWLDEKTAAAMLGKKPETLRRRAKAAKWPITYTSVSQRAYQYSKADLEKFLLNNSNKIK
jgi:hypothetical protein